MADQREQRVLEALEAVAAEHGFDVVDVEIVGASKAPAVRVRIDHADESLPTIGLDEVTANTHWISEVLDEVDPISGSYSLEVSSPGMARPLRRQRDFERFAGETVQLAKVPGAGRRKYTGTLEGFEDGSIVLTVDGERVLVPLGELSRCTIKPTYDFK